MEGIPTKILGQGILKQCHFANALFNHKVHIQVACKKFVIIIVARESIFRQSVCLIPVFIF